MRGIYVAGDGESPARIVLVVHHLVVDEVSWSVLLADLEAASNQLAADAAVRLPSKTTSFKTWAQRLTDYVSSGGFDSELQHWQAVEANESDRLPVDFESASNVESNAQHVVVALDERWTEALIRELPAIHGCEIMEVFLAALSCAVCTWCGSSSLVVDVEGHGREGLFDDVDHSRTVGWFTTMYPVRLEPDPNLSVSGQLAAVRRQLRAVSAHGLGYGALRYLTNLQRSPGDRSLARRPDLAFNYLGQTPAGVRSGSLPRRVSNMVDFVRDPTAPRTHLIEVNSRIVARQLEVVWIYSDQMYRREEIERVAHGYVDGLQELIRRSRREATDTPGSQRFVMVSQLELDALSGLLASDGDDEDR